MHSATVRARPLVQNLLSQCLASASTNHSLCNEHTGLPSRSSLIVRSFSAPLRHASTSSTPVPPLGGETSSLIEPKASTPSPKDQLDHLNKPLATTKVISEPRRLFEASCMFLDRHDYDYEHGWTLYTALRDAGQPEEMKIRTIIAFVERCIQRVHKDSMPSRGGGSAQTNEELQHRWGERIATILVDITPKLKSPAVRRPYESRWHKLAMKARALRGNQDIVPKESDAKMLRNLKLDINSRNGAYEKSNIKWSALYPDSNNGSTYDYEGAWAVYSTLRGADRLDELKSGTIFAFAEKLMTLVRSEPPTGMVEATPAPTTTTSDETQRLWAVRVTQILGDASPRLKHPNMQLYRHRWDALTAEVKGFGVDLALDVATSDAEKMKDAKALRNFVLSLRNSNANPKDVKMHMGRLFVHSKLSASPYNYENGWAAYAALRDAGKLDDLHLKTTLDFAEQCIKLVQNVSSSSHGDGSGADLQRLWSQRIDQLLVDIAPRAAHRMTRREYGSRWHLVSAQARALRGDVDAALNEADASLLRKLDLDINVRNDHVQQPTQGSIFYKMDHEHGWAIYVTLRNEGKLGDLKVGEILHFVAHAIESVQSLPMTSTSTLMTRDSDVDMQHLWGERISEILEYATSRLTDLQATKELKVRLRVLTAQVHALRGEVEAALKVASELRNPSPEGTTYGSSSIDKPETTPGLMGIYGSCLLSVCRHEGVVAALAFMMSHRHTFEAVVFKSSQMKDRDDVISTRKALRAVVYHIEHPKALLVNPEYAQKWGPEATLDLAQMLISTLRQLRRTEDVLAMDTWVQNQLKQDSALMTAPQIFSLAQRRTATVMSLLRYSKLLKGVRSTTISAAAQGLYDDITRTAPLDFLETHAYKNTGIELARRRKWLTLDGGNAPKIIVPAPEAVAEEASPAAGDKPPSTLVHDTLSAEK